MPNRIVRTSAAVLFALPAMPDIRVNDWLR